MERVAKKFWGVGVILNQSILQFKNFFNSCLVWYLSYLFTEILLYEDRSTVLATS